MRKSNPPRGFTLLELLVGAAVGAVVLLGISLTFISQARQYQTHASRRAIQANARQAISFVSRHLRNAGYGVNPDRAIIPYDSFNARSGTVGDTEPGYPDALIIHSRDLLFRRDLTIADANMLTVTAPVTLRRGQILLVLCRESGRVITPNNFHAFVTVGADVENAVQIPLEAAGPATPSPLTGPGAPFHEQATLGTHTCFNSGQVVRINRAAFYVDSFQEPGGGARGTPYLMMHQGLDTNDDGAIDRNDSVPVAEGIEQFQVAYILNTFQNVGDPLLPPLLFGVDEQTGILPDTQQGEAWRNLVPVREDEINPDPAELKNQYTALGADQGRWSVRVGLTHPFRRSNHPANIRQVRLTMVSRSSVPDQQHPGDNLLTEAAGEEMEGVGIPWRQLENLSLSGPAAEAPDFNPSGGGYYRVILRETITTRNLSMSNQFLTTTIGGG